MVNIIDSFSYFSSFSGWKWQCINKVELKLFLRIFMRQKQWSVPSLWGWGWSCLGGSLGWLFGMVVGDETEGPHNSDRNTHIAFHKHFQSTAGDEYQSGQRAFLWNYLITMRNSVANCRLLIGLSSTSVTIWWAEIYLLSFCEWCLQ